MPSPLFSNWKKTEEEPIDYSKLMSRPEDMNMTPVSQSQIPVSEELIKYDALRSPENVAMMAPEPALDSSKLRSPEVKQMLVDYLKGKSAGPETPEDPMAAIDREMAGSKEAARKQKLYAGIGMGLDKIIGGITHSDIQSPFYEEGMKTADAPVKAATEKKKMLQDYLQNKTKMDLDKTRSEKELKMLEESLRHNRVMEGQANQRLRLDEEQGKLKYQKESQKEQEEKLKPVQEVESRAKTIKDNIATLKQMIKEKGTYEVLGAHNKILNTTAMDIAVDLAKLKDPTSSAQSGEVQRELADLVQSGMFQSNDSAIASLDALEKRLGQRVKNAYDVRKIPVPQSIQYHDEQAALDKREQELLRKAGK